MVSLKEVAMMYILGVFKGGNCVLCGSGVVYGVLGGSRVVRGKLAGICL